MMRKKALVLILFTICLAGGIYVLDQDPIWDYCKTPINQPALVTNMTSGFSADWHLGEIYIYGRRNLVPSSESSFLFANNNRVVFYGNYQKCNQTMITSLDVENGQLLQEGVLYYRFQGPLQVINQAGDNLYLGYGGFGQLVETSTMGAGGVAKYNINEHKIVWERVVTGANSIVYLVTNGNRLFFKVNTGDYHLLDNDNENLALIAEAKTRRDDFDEESNDLPCDYFDPCHYAIWHQTLEETEERVQVPLTSESLGIWQEIFVNVHQPPIVVDDIIVFVEDLSGLRTIKVDDVLVFGEDLSGLKARTIKAVDKRDGSIIWQTQSNVLSNIAVSNGFAFYVTTSSELVAVDVQNGLHLGSVHFSGSPRDLNTLRILNESMYVEFYVATNDNNQVFVYLGDTRQLFAFQFTPPSSAVPPPTTHP